MSIERNFRRDAIWLELMWFPSHQPLQRPLLRTLNVVSAARGQPPHLSLQRVLAETAVWIQN
jgi:hypothetical protein